MRTFKKLLAVFCMVTLLMPVNVSAAANSGSKTDISKATVTVVDQTYNGSEQTAAVTVKLGDTALVADKDYTVSGNKNTNAGKYTITVKGMGNYTGSATATYEIKAKSASKLKVTVNTATYTGKKQTAKIVVKDGSKTLKKGTDYTVKGTTSAKKAGKYKITVTGKGNYTGSKTVTFTIKQATQKVNVKAPTVKASAVKNKAKTYKLSVSGVKDKAKLSYASNSKQITIDKTGKITVKKGTKKGTKATITVKVAATNNYKALTKKVTITVK